MNSIQQQLEWEGLREAGQDEAGWHWKCLNESGELITLWVTELTKAEKKAIATVNRQRTRYARQSEIASELGYFNDKGKPSFSGVITDIQKLDSEKLAELKKLLSS